MMMTISPLYHSEGESEVAARIVRVEAPLHGPRERSYGSSEWGVTSGRPGCGCGGGERFLDGGDGLAIVFDHMARAVRVPTSHVGEEPRRDPDRRTRLRGLAYLHPPVCRRFRSRRPRIPWVSDELASRMAALRDPV